MENFLVLVSGSNRLRWLLDFRFTEYLCGKLHYLGWYMLKRILVFSLFINLLCGHARVGFDQLPDVNYLIVYVESNDVSKIDAFIQEMEGYSNKVVDVKHDPLTHEFTVMYTDVITEKTIFQIMDDYFDHRLIKKIGTSIK